MFIKTPYTYVLTTAETSELAQPGLEEKSSMARQHYDLKASKGLGVFRVFLDSLSGFPGFVMFWVNKPGVSMVFLWFLGAFVNFG